jgi:RNA polymerase sigma-70 factor, ECF subfamily
MFEFYQNVSPFGRQRLIIQKSMEDPMSDTDGFTSSLIGHLPHLRGFARMIARDHTLADDLVQDTVVQALAKRTQFTPGTNLRAWLTTILRNRFFNEMRRSRYKTEVSVECPDDSVPVDGGQEVSIEIRDFKRIFRGLPAVQREALILVGASGFSYDEAAAIAGCPIGTLKSRLSRARACLQQQLDGQENDAPKFGRPGAGIEGWEAPYRRRAYINTFTAPIPVTRRYGG